MTNRLRVIILTLAVTLTGALALPSGAAPLFSGPTDTVGQDVELAPSSEYAYLEDGDLVVDFTAANPSLDSDGVNDDAVTGIGDVFEVRYNGSEYAHVWLTHESEDVTFHVDGESIQSEANNVTLAPNESVAVGLEVDTRGEATDGLIDDITVHAKVAEGEDTTGGAELAFDGPTVQSRAPTADSRRFTVFGGGAGSVYTFDANGLELDRAGDAPLRLEEVVVGNADGSLSLGVEAVRGESSRALVTEAGPEPLGVARVDVETGRVSNATLRFSAATEYLAARDATAETLAVYRDDDGTLSKLDVTVTERRDGRVFFEAETPGFSSFVVAADRARLAVTDATLDRSVVEPGETVTVTGTVSNDGTLAGERRVAVTVDGTVVAERTVAVEAGGTATLTAPIELSDAGEYAVAVDGVDAGSFVVEPSDSSVADTSAESAEEQAGGDGPSTPESIAEEPAGFGLDELFGLVTLLALVAATLLLARRAPWR